MINKYLVIMWIVLQITSASACVKDTFFILQNYKLVVTLQ